ncbi:MAG: 2-hydroxychromene-2-carboxylate isomerase [Pseudolabrys sp.]
MNLTVTVFWSFRSPYSYIVTPRLVALARDHDVVVDIRIVHPAAIRNPDLFRHMNPLARPYFVRDSARAAAFHGVPFRRPVPDPIDQDMQTLKIAPEQPLALRLGRLGIVAAQAGKALSFCDEVSRLLWNGETDGWHEGDHLARAAARSGLELAAMEKAIAADPGRYDKALADNDAALRAAGHWGVPTFVFEGEPFFGQDRFDVLMWRLKQSGLRLRS